MMMGKQLPSPQRSHAHDLADSAEFSILVSLRFQKRLRESHDKPLRRDLLACIRELVSARERWPSLHVKKPAQADAGRKVRMARINSGDRLIFEGPLRPYAGLRPVLFLHDFCSHDEISQVTRRVLDKQLEEGDFIAMTPADLLHDTDGTPPVDILPTDLTAFCRPIPSLWLSSPDEANLDDEDLRLLVHPTRRQWDILTSPRPTLISGSAGCGKTTILCLSLAWSIRYWRQQRQQRRLLYVSWNHKLVEQARRYVNRFLGACGEKPVGDEARFLSFQDLLTEHVLEPSAFRPERRVSFGKFKPRYERYRRGAPHARGIPAEWAWHIIRSVMKGACLPVFDDDGCLQLSSRPPLPQDRYMKLAEKRREVSPEQYEKVYRIGLWYQEEVIAGGRMWDDQDLAWEALRCIQRKEQQQTLDRFDEVFVDEVQDLTALEFKALVSLCAPPSRAELEGVCLTVAGDPLQTITPTGFRWSLIGELVYEIDGKPVYRHELVENWRCDQRIVALANEIQGVRSRFLRKELPRQTAHLKDEADHPQAVAVVTEADSLAVVEGLDRLPPDTAVVLWCEDDDELLELLQRDRCLSQLVRRLGTGDRAALDKVAASMSLYKIPETKGLEFRRVILYRFGDSEEFMRYWREAQAGPGPQEGPLDTPILYFLNRLYISVTRAESYLFIIDGGQAVDEVWRHFHSVQVLDGPHAVEELWRAPAFQESPDWEAWGDKLFHHAEGEDETRQYERARRAYLNAGAIQKARLAEARVAELRTVTVSSRCVGFERAGSSPRIGGKRPSISLSMQGPTGACLRRP